MCYFCQRGFEINLLQVQKHRDNLYIHHIFESFDEEPQWLCNYFEDLEDLVSNLIVEPIPKTPKEIIALFKKYTFKDSHRGKFDSMLFADASDFFRAMSFGNTKIYNDTFKLYMGNKPKTAREIADICSENVYKITREVPDSWFCYKIQLGEISRNINALSMGDENLAKEAFMLYVSEFLPSEIDEKPRQFLFEARKGKKIVEQAKLEKIVQPAKTENSSSQTKEIVQQKENSSSQTTNLVSMFERFIKIPEIVFLFAAFLIYKAINH